MSRISYRTILIGGDKGYVIHRASLARALKNGVKPFCDIPLEKYGNISRNEYYEVIWNRVRRYKTREDLVREHKWIFL